MEGIKAVGIAALLPITAGAATWAVVAAHHGGHARQASRPRVASHASPTASQPCWAPWSTPAPATPRPPVATPPPRDPHYAIALAEADRLLSMAPVFPGAVALPQTTDTPPNPNGMEPSQFVGSLRRWTTSQAPADVIAWFQAHRPLDLAVGTSGERSTDSCGQVGGSLTWTAAETDAYTEAQVTVDAALTGPDLTLITASGEATWLTTAPARDSDRGPRVHLTLAGGCPAGLEFADVTNPPGRLSDHMVPPGRPVAGLVCHYATGGRPTQPASRSGSLPAQQRLAAAAAGRLAQAVAGIRLGSPGPSWSNCPMDQGQVDIIVLSYPGEDVDLWYKAAGCEFLDNGFVLADEGGNPSFYSGFIPVYESVLGERP